MNNERAPAGCCTAAVYCCISAETLLYNACTESQLCPVGWSEREREHRERGESTDRARIERAEGINGRETPAT